MPYISGAWHLFTRLCNQNSFIGLWNGVSYTGGKTNTFRHLTSPGQWAACIPAARQRLWGDGAGCTANRTPAAHGSVTGPQTPAERERETSVHKQSDTPSWFLCGYITCQRATRRDFEQLQSCCKMFLEDICTCHVLKRKTSINMFNPLCLLWQCKHEVHTRPHKHAVLREHYLYTFVYVYCGKWE